MARDGMSEVIRRLRMMTEAGTADYSIAGTTYWTDDQLQSELDAYRVQHYGKQLKYNAMNESGTVAVYDYVIPARFVERITASDSAFVVRDEDGDAIGTANYSVNYDAGVITFGVETGGSVVMLDYREFDIYRAAAHIWNEKASHVANRFDLGTDNQSLKRSQLLDHYRKMAKEMKKMAGARLRKMRRSDVR